MIPNGHHVVIGILRWLILRITSQQNRMAGLILPCGQIQIPLLAKPRRGLKTCYIVYTEKYVKLIWICSSTTYMRIFLQNSAQEYNRLIQKWTKWATWKDIPLDGIGDLPNARRYLRQSRVEKWVTSRLKIGSRPE